jgi:histidyl-tRNA synthetase
MPQSLVEIFSYLELLGIPKSQYQFDPTLARGLDYYTGIIFEGYIPEYTVGSVGGGGRYNNLLQSLVGVDMPAIGFGLGFDRTLEAADMLGTIPTFKGTSTILVTIFSPEFKKQSYSLASWLRKQNISTETYLDENKPIDKQLKYANKKGIPYVAIIGPEEADKNIVKVKDMTTGEQKSITPEELTQLLKV